MTDTPVRVLLADDNPLLRMGLSSLLSSHDGIEVIGEAADGAEAVALAERHRPDIAVLDVRMPEQDGIAAARLMPCGTRILMLTHSDDADTISAAMAGGAHGYLVHGSHTPQEIVEAVLTAARGLAVLGPDAAAVILTPDRPTAPDPDPPDRAAIYGLTPREAEIMELVAGGLRNGEIAARLHLAEKTVKNHVNRVFAKLHARSRAEAVSLWLQAPGRRRAGEVTTRPGATTTPARTVRAGARRRAPGSVSDTGTELGPWAHDASLRPA